MLGSFWGGRKRDRFGWKAYFFPEKYLVLVWKRRGPYSLCIGWRREGGSPSSVHLLRVLWTNRSEGVLEENTRVGWTSSTLASAALSSSGSRTMQQQTEGNHTLHDLWESTKKTLRIAAAIHHTHTAQQLIHRFWAIGQPKLFSHLLAPNINIHYS